jgi:hypothetical protein
VNSTSQGSRVRRRSSCLFYNLINLMLVSFFFRQATIIRGDGPGGFGEFVVKGLLLWVALGFFAAGVISSVLSCKGDKPEMKLRKLWIVPMILFLLSSLGLYEACSDGAGHCRHWQLFFP